MITLECEPPQFGAEEAEQMKFLNLETAIWSTEEYTGCEPMDRATWLCLMFYCAVVENGGRILGCKRWSNGKCEQILKLKRREILRESPLWWFDGDDLMVLFYPVAQERTQQTRVNVSVVAANSRWKKERMAKSGENGDAAGSENPDASAKDKSLNNRATAPETGGQFDAPRIENPPAEGKGREGNGREGNITEGKGREWKGFPPTPDAAVEMAPEYSPEFVRKEWIRAAARGGCNHKLQPIADWLAYLQIEKEFRDTAPGGVAKGELAPWRRLELLQAELKEVKDQIAACGRPHPDVNPEAYAAAEAKRIPLRQRRDELIKKISELNTNENQA